MFRQDDMADKIAPTLDEILPPVEEERKYPLTDIDFNEAENFDLFDRVRDGLGEFEDNAFYTPDLPSLMKLSSHYLFTYGTLKKGFSRSSVLDNSPFVGYGVTCTNKWVMAHTKNAMPYPIALLSPNPEKQGRIFGEVYRVRPALIRRLDFIESNGSLYKRWLTQIRTVTDKEGNHKDIYCWMYRGVSNYWGTRLSQLAACQRFIPNREGADPYYCFNENLEY